MTGEQALRILVVDDDRAVRESLRRALGLEGWDVALAADGLQAIAAIDEAPVDLVVLDVMMPGVDGLGVVRRLRSDGRDVPVVLLTARDAVADRVAGLDEGADDYLTKPFALPELLARIRALLRRRGAEKPDARRAEVLTFADVVVDSGAMRATRGDVELDLTRTEYDLLEIFMENPDRVLPRSVLHDRVWGYDASTSSNTLEVHVGTLRRKLEAPDAPRIIQTVRGVGYVLRDLSGRQGRR